MGSEKRVRLGHRGVSFILSIFEVHLEVIDTKVGGVTFVHLHLQ